MALFEVKSIIMHRLLSTGEAEFLVAWKEYSLKESTWEPIKSFDGAQKVLSKYCEDYTEKLSIRTVNDFTPKTALAELKRYIAAENETATVQNLMSLNEEKETTEVEPEVSAVPRKMHSGTRGFCETCGVPDVEETIPIDQLKNHLDKMYLSKTKKKELGLTDKIIGDSNIKRACMNMAYDYIQKNWRAGGSCLFCKGPHSSVLCREIKYYAERRNFAKEHKICIRCETQHGAGTICTVGVCMCRCCGSKKHRTAFCNLNNINTWLE